MSYSVEFWNSFDKIGNLFLSSLTGAKNLKDIFNILFTSLNSFSNNLKDLYNNYDYEITTHKSLYESILYFREDFLNINNYLIDLILGLKNEIIKPLNNIQSIFLNKYLIYKEGIYKLEEEYEENRKELENSKANFYKSVKELEDYKINFENEKINVCDLSIEYKKEKEEAIIELLKAAKESQKEYLININKINKFQKEYIEQKKNNLNNMQYMEEQLGECIKDSLRKFILYLMAFIRNVQYDLENTSKKYDEIDVNKDIKFFINQNSTKDILPFKYEFIPYTSNIGKRYKNVSNEIIKDIRNFISTIFNNGTEMQNISLISNNKSIDIKELAEYIFRINNNNYKNNNKEIIFKQEIDNILLNKQIRKALLKEINQIRIKGNIFINDYNFNNIGDFLKKCINIIIKENKKDLVNANDEYNIDYESMNLIFIIATNLYKIHEYGNKPRLFLQENMTDIPIFSDFNFWKNIIRYFIVNEMHTQKNYNLYENNENKEKRNEKLIKNKINSFIYHMKAFEVKNKLINDIIFFFQNYYGLDSKILESLLIKDENEKIKSDDENCFHLDADKDGDNNLVINIPNTTFNHKSSINSIYNKE